MTSHIPKKNLKRKGASALVNKIVYEAGECCTKDALV